ncbi:MAG: hypothetical protein WA431_09530 [Candidatus Cybelea sp.]
MKSLSCLRCAFSGGVVAASLAGRGGAQVMEVEPSMATTVT